MTRPAAAPVLVQSSVRKSVSRSVFDSRGAGDGGDDGEGAVGAHGAGHDAQPADPPQSRFACRLEVQAPRTHPLRCRVDRVIGLIVVVEVIGSIDGGLPTVLLG